MQAFDVATKFENFIICGTMAGVFSRFSFATTTEKQLKQRKNCKRQCFFVVGLEKVVFREGKGNRKLRADSA